MIRKSIAARGGCKSRYPFRTGELTAVIKISTWRQWLEHPEKLPVHRPFFPSSPVGRDDSRSLCGVRYECFGQRHCLSQCSGRFGQPAVASFSRDRMALLDFHENLLRGMTGRAINGIGALCLTLARLTGTILWWPGVANWRRSMSVNWRSSFARLNWDLHNALEDFWCLLFVPDVGNFQDVLRLSRPIFNALVDFPLQTPGTSGRIQFGYTVLLWLSESSRWQIRLVYRGPALDAAWALCPQSCHSPASSCVAIAC